jgi:glycosyltransferase involved in cell wall biosynthesis
LRRADAILVQSAWQADAMARNYGLASHPAGMLVEQAPPASVRDIDVLWLGNIRRVKRPDRALELAAALRTDVVHMAGGPLPGEEALCEIREAALAADNIRFHGRLSYWEANELYGRASVLVNTSDVEGFPNSYLQAWVRGVPVVTLIDPDGVIRREGLGIAVSSPGELAEAVRSLVHNRSLWGAASERCMAYMAREYAEDKVLRAYLDAFRGAHGLGQGPTMMVANDARAA